MLVYSHRVYCKCDHPSGANHSDRVQHFCRNAMLCLLWVAALFPVDKRQLWAPCRSENPAHWRRFHPHYHQREPPRSRPFQVPCVQSNQQWHQWTNLPNHQLWVFIKGKLDDKCLMWTMYNVAYGGLNNRRVMNGFFLQWSFEVLQGKKTKNKNIGPKHIIFYRLNTTAIQLWHSLEMFWSA